LFCCLETIHINYNLNRYCENRKNNDDEGYTAVAAAAAAEEEDDDVDCVLY